ncbi:MAG: glycosyltransferase [Bifidobacteriaceae bacterium]|jgi:hypothetical protein|nr:glycosyltransferase [Bifidobacteriaceae bacterium]
MTTNDEFIQNTVIPDGTNPVPTVIPDGTNPVPPVIPAEAGIYPIAPAPTDIAGVAVDVAYSAANVAVDVAQSAANAATNVATNVAQSSVGVAATNVATNVAQSTVGVAATDAAGVVLDKSAIAHAEFIKKVADLTRPYPFIYNKLRLAYRAKNDPYIKWHYQNYPNPMQLKQDAEAIAAKKYPISPTFTFLFYVRDFDIAQMTSFVSSITAQTYKNHQIIIINDGSSNKNIQLEINKLAIRDDTIVTVQNDTPTTKVQAFTNAMQYVRGEFIAYIDSPDNLWPNCLDKIVASLNEELVFNTGVGNQKTNRYSCTDFIYTDSETIDSSGKLNFNPLIKSDYDLATYTASDYISKPIFFRRTLIDQFGGPKMDYEQMFLWELGLRISSQIDPSRILHIPEILYAVREVQNY